MKHKKLMLRRPPKAEKVHLINNVKKNYDNISNIEHYCILNGSMDGYGFGKFFVSREKMIFISNLYFSVGLELNTSDLISIKMIDNNTNIYLLFSNNKEVIFKPFDNILNCYQIIENLSKMHVNKPLIFKKPNTNIQHKNNTTETNNTNDIINNNNEIKKTINDDNNIYILKKLDPETEIEINNFEIALSPKEFFDLFIIGQFDHINFYQSLEDHENVHSDEWHKEEKNKKVLMKRIISYKLIFKNIPLLTEKEVKLEQSYIINSNPNIFKIKTISNSENIPGCSRYYIEDFIDIIPKKEEKNMCIVREYIIMDIHANFIIEGTIKNVTKSSFIDGGKIWVNYVKSKGYEINELKKEDEKDEDDD